FHLPATQMAVEANIITYGSTPQLVAGCVQRFAENIPQRNVDAADGCRADDTVTVPEMLPIHHLPHVLDAPRVFADEQLADILNGANDRAGVPLERSFTPAPQAGLIGDDLDEDPVAHARMADVGFDGGDFHDGLSLFDI